VVIATALGTLNLTVAAELVSRLVDYVPNILAAIFILIVGAFLADFVAAIVRTTAGNAGINKSSLLAKITKTIIIIFAVIIAIEQLKIASAIIVLAVNIILISIGIGAALAFGLGCKDIAGKFVQEVINNMKK
jgi:small-conductance mechanosensitive channel